MKQWSFLAHLVFLAALFAPGARAQAPSETSFVFDADERLFTAHAFMNAGGYDMEYNSGGMHPIRAEVRRLLGQRLAESYRDSIRTYYAAHDHYLGYYGTYALALGPPPELELLFDSTAGSPWVKGEINALPDLDARLREFYQRAGIDSIWQQYRPQIQQMHDRYRPHAAFALGQLKAYFRTEGMPLEQEGRRIVTAFSPLMSYFQAFTVTVNGDVYLVFGPQPGDPSPAAYYHEAAHYFVDPVVERYRLQAERLAPLFRLVRDKDDSIGYAILEESMVRTVDKLLSGRLLGSSEDEIRERIHDEYKLGFILCPYFFEHLKDFEASEDSLEAYFPTLLAGIDVEFEESRWKTYWSGRQAELN